jgi:hypothetical protein
MLRALCLAVLLSTFAFPQDQKPEVHLNHAFIVPDAETYDAIRNSDFVKQFAVWEERTTKRKDITYTGFYLYGQHTYFEFLKPDDPKLVGGSAIAFGVDRTGDLDLLQKRAEAAGMKTEIQTITRAFNGKDVDWFRSLKRKDEDGPSIGIWTLEYVPTFLSEWNPTPKEKPSVRREDVLKRYAEVVNQKPTKKALEDVFTVVMQLPEAGIRASMKDCGVLGFCDSHSVEEPEPAHLRMADAWIMLRKGDVAAITCVMFKLRRRLPYSEHAFGKTKLFIKGDEAVWEIVAPVDQSSCRGLLAPH